MSDWLRIPDSALPHCAKCGHGFAPGMNDVYASEISGWSVPRKKGGQNHVVGRRETGRVLCPECTVKLKYGGVGVSEQGKLV